MEYGKDDVDRYKLAELRRCLALRPRYETSVNWVREQRCRENPFTAVT